MQNHRPNQLPVYTVQIPSQDPFLLLFLKNSNILINSIQVNILNHQIVYHSKKLSSHLSKFQFHVKNYKIKITIQWKILDQLISDTTLQILIHSFLFHNLHHNIIQSIFEPQHNLHFQLIDQPSKSVKRLYYYLLHTKYL